MKVLLINPIYGLFQNKPTKAMFNGPPLGLLYIASVLERSGHECRVIDCNSSGMDLAGLQIALKDFQPDICGLQCLTNYIKDVFLICNNVKHVVPKAVTIVGGPHAIHLPEELLDDVNIDFVCTGEGEYLMQELMTELDTTCGSFSSIKGLGYKDNGRIVINQPRPFIEDLEQLPFPSYHLLDLGIYNASRFSDGTGTFASVSTGRGCPNACVFCDIPCVAGKKYRTVGTEVMAYYFERLHKEFNVTKIKITDPTLTLFNKRLLGFAEKLITRNLGIQWSISGSVRTLPDLAGLKLLKRAGCVNIFFGIESGDPKILGEVKKITPEQAIEAVQRTKDANISPHCSFIIGLPGETKATIQRSISFAKKLNPDTASFSIATPFPGTELYNLYDRNGYILHKDWSRYEVEPVISLPGGLTPEYLSRMYKKAHRDFYFRPGYIFRRLSAIRSFSQVSDYLQMAGSLLTGFRKHKL